MVSVAAWACVKLQSVSSAVGADGSWTASIPNRPAATTSSTLSLCSVYALSALQRFSRQSRLHRPPGDSPPINSYLETTESTYLSPTLACVFWTSTLDFPSGKTHSLHMNGHIHFWV